MDSKPKNLSQAIDELERATRGKATDLKERFEQEIHRLEDTVKSLKPQLDELQSKIGDEAKKAKDRVENEVQKNPLAAVGVVGLIFFILGFLLAKSGRRDD